MTAAEFIRFVRDECRYYGIRVQMGNGATIRNGGNDFCAGYFDPDNKVLAIARNNIYFLPVLAHEYCHMRQWIEKAPVWVLSEVEKSYQAWGRHLDGHKVEMDHHYDIMRDLELDNEKRTVALMKKLSLPVDRRDYTRKANAYIHLYNYMKVTGRWPKRGHMPHQRPRIINAMPEKFNMRYDRIPAWLEKLYRDEGV